MTFVLLELLFSVHIVIYTLYRFAFIQLELKVFHLRLPIMLKPQPSLKIHSFDLSIYLRLGRMESWYPVAYYPNAFGFQL